MAPILSRYGHATGLIGALFFANGALAATPQELGRWSGCYEIAMTKVSTAHDKPIDGSTEHHARVQLTSDLVPATSGAYVVRLIGEPEERSVSQWWPVDEQSFLLAIGDGFVGWSATLRVSGSHFKGTARAGTDTGRMLSNWNIVATKVSCE